MCRLIQAAVLNQQVPTDEIRQTRTMLDAIVPGYRATWSKFDSSEEIADFPCGIAHGEWGGQDGGSCCHHEQVNRKAEWSVRGLLGPVGDTNPAPLPLGSRLAVLAFSFR